MKDQIQQKRTKVPFSDVFKALSHKWVKNVANQKKFFFDLTEFIFLSIKKRTMFVAFLTVLKKLLKVCENIVANFSVANDYHSNSTCYI